MDRKTKLKLIAVFLLKRRKFVKNRITALMLALMNSQTTLNFITNLHINWLHTHTGLLLNNGPMAESQSSNSNQHKLFWENNVPEMDDSNFKDHFRVSRDSFEKIYEKINGATEQDTSIKPCLHITVEKKVAIALHALGSPTEYTQTSKVFGLGPNVVKEIVTDFCRTVCNNFSHCISSYPPTTEEIKKVVNGFGDLGFPQCFGAIDAYHVQVNLRKDKTFEYYNSEGWYSIILLASCDHNSKFTYINVGTPGSKTKYSAFRNSSLKRFHARSSICFENCITLCNTDVPVLLIGDSGFRLSHYLMQPYPLKNDQLRKKKIFNKRLQKAHQVIKNAFVQLRARFRSIESLNMTLSNCNTVIKACCFLHNFLKNEEDNVTNAWIEESANTARPIQPKYINNSEVDVDAESIRSAIVQSFYEE